MKRRVMARNRAVIQRKEESLLAEKQWAFLNYHSLLKYGGPDGELGASLRYLSQRFSMPYPELKGLLTDIGTEESAP